ncbi:MAG: dTDP-4-amino-4,6-dideoxygalactose transaminase [Blastocatellia bacterium]
MQPKIPFNKPFITGREIEYIARALSDGKIAGDGFFTRGCQDLLEQRFNIPRVLLTPSCTAALEMAALLCDLKPGDEVIMPSFTFVSTANPVVRAGARPVFVEIRPDTLNIDERLIERSITPNTRAIFVVHYAGVSCEMDRIMETARQHELIVVEDAAQGVNAFYNGRALGSIGHLGAYSFHDTKNYVCGEGGALCINEPKFAERAEIIREKGTNRSQFFRGEVDKYSWVDIGSSYIPAEITSAFLLAQLEAIDEITARRLPVHQFYLENLARLEERELLSIPRAPSGCESNYHMFYILLRDGETRDGLMAHLKQNGISAVFHYVPLHSSTMGQRFGYREGDLPLTEDLSMRLLRLPFFPDITRDEQMRVVRCLSEFLEVAGRVSSGRQQR